MKIGINCGHTIDGQPGSGAIGYISESVETRNVGKKLINLLKQAGNIVYDCTDDYAISTSDNLNTIVSMVNNQPLDLFVSIHFNSGGGNGTEVFTYSGQKYAEAINVCNSLNSLGFKNRGIKDGSHLAVIRKSNVKSMLIEICFVDTDDAQLYKRIGADGIAQAICQAITGINIRESEELTMTQYEELKQTKQDKPMIYDYMDSNMPDWAKPTIQKLMNRGALVGNDGKLGLTMDMIKTFVVNDRMGLYD